MFGGPRLNVFLSGLQDTFVSNSKTILLQKVEIKLEKRDGFLKSGWSILAVTDQRLW